MDFNLELWEDVACWARMASSCQRLFYRRFTRQAVLPQAVLRRFVWRNDGKAAGEKNHLCLDLLFFGSTFTLKSGRNNSCSSETAV